MFTRDHDSARASSVTCQTDNCPRPALDSGEQFRACQLVDVLRGAGSCNRIRSSYAVGPSREVIQDCLGSKDVEGCRDPLR